MKKLTKNGEWFAETIEYRPLLQSYISGCILMYVYCHNPGYLFCFLLVVGGILEFITQGFNAGWRRTK